MLLIKTREIKKALSTFILLGIVAFCEGDVLSQNLNAPNNAGPLGTQVNTLSGNLFVPRTDIFIPGRGISSINISFYYNSFNYYKNLGYGNGWTFKYGMRYTTDTTGAVTVYQGDDREDVYTQPVNGTFTSPTGIFDELKEYQTGKYLLSTKEGMQYYFDNSTSKRLTKMIEPNGNFLTFTYSDTLITSISNSAGQTVSLTYSKGLLTSVIDALASPSRTFSYEYDGYGNLSKVTDPAGYSIKYKYLVNGPMSETTDKNDNTANIIYYADYSISELISCNSRKSFSYDTTSNITTVTDYVPGSSNQVTTYHYQKYKELAWVTSISGNCCGFNMSFEFDNNGNMVKKTDANGNEYTYTYDNKGNLLTITDPLNRVSTYTYSPDFSKVTGYTDPSGNIYKISYDSKGNPVTFTEPGNITSTAKYSAGGDIVSWTDANGNTYQYNYDAYGNMTSIINPLSSSVISTYDARGNLVTSTDAKGNKYTAQHDILGRLTSITDPLNNLVLMSYDAEGNVKTITDRNGNKRTFYYDASNRITSITGPAGYSDQYFYDAAGNIIQYKDKLGNTTDFKYDNRNRLTKVTDPAGDLYSYNYDNNGNITSATYPNGQTINYTYDKVNKLISSADENGSFGSVTYDNNGNVISSVSGTGSIVSATYDANNNRTSITDPLGNKMSFTYDKNHNLLTSEDRNGNKETFNYDALSRVISHTDRNGLTNSTLYDASGHVLSVTDQNNNTTKYDYDALGRLIKATFPDGKSFSNTYDKIGHRVSKQLNDGSVISYEYNQLNRLKSKTLAGGNFFSYDYDVKGRLIAAGNAAGTISLTYDALDRLKSEQFNNHKTSYDYNLLNKTITVRYPDSSIHIRAYDSRNRLIGLKRNGNDTIAVFSYDSDNMLQQIIYGNGIVTNLTYDLAHRLLNISATSGYLVNRSIGYDKQMNKVSVTDGAFPQESEQFTYDAKYQLTGYKQGELAGGTISSPVTRKTYSYDAAGNRTSETVNGLNTTYEVNNLNQLVAATSSSGNISFTYSANGNLTYDGKFYKKYDGDGRLLADSSSSEKILYVYDAFGRRVQKISNGKTLNYYYAGLKQIELRDASSDSLVNQIIYSNSFIPVTGLNKQQKFFYHQNELSSVEAISDSTGKLVERYNYDPYGKTRMYDAANQLLTQSKIGNRFGFAGQEYDAETGNYHFHYRDYSPSAGRFNQRDPIGYFDGMNMYQYVHNNPVNKIDPLGLRDCPPFGPPIILVTNKDWEEQVNQMRKKFNNEDEILFTQAQNFDSKYFSEPNAWGKGAADQMYSFRGKLYSAMELNYYFQGMLFKAKGYSNSTLHNAVGGWKKIRYGETPSQSVMEMADLGYNETDVSFDYEHKVINIESDYAEPSYHEQQEYKNSDHSSYQDPKNLPDVPKDDAFYDYHRVIDPNTGEVSVHGFLRIGSQLDSKAKYLGPDADRIEQLRKWRREGKIPPPKEPDCPPNNNNGGTNKRNPPGPGRPGTTGTTTVLNSKDPNEIIGPNGVGTPKWVGINEPMPYTILYENAIAASAPAKFVKVTYPVDPKQDINNFSLGSFGFNNLTFNVPPNTPSFYERLNVVDSLGLFVDVTAGLDVVKHQIFWTFQSIDPVTQLPPTDPLKGFLKLRDTTNLTSGHGFVNFTIKPNPSANTGDTTHATASILFDLNDTIPTNAARNTIDAIAPVSHINSVPATTGSNTVSLSWSGQDDAGGSGLKSYALYMSANGGDYALVKSGMTRTDTTFTGAFNNTYGFFVLATDSAGNAEGLRPGSEVTVLMSDGALPVTWLFFNANLRGKDGVLTWATANETNSKDYEIERSADGRNFTKIGIVSANGNSSVQSNYLYTDLNVVSLNVPVVYYRLKQTDKDGKVTYSNVIALQLPTTVTGPIVKAYPNPFKQSLNVMIANAPQVGPNDRIEVYTLDGKRIYNRMIGRRAANSSITLDDLPLLTPGMYILKLDLNKQKFSFKVVKQ